MNELFYIQIYWLRERKKNPDRTNRGAKESMGSRDQKAWIRKSEWFYAHESENTDKTDQLLDGKKTAQKEKQKQPK